MSEIKTTHRDIEITYNEHRNRWACELFSKDAESLADARERIDKKLDAEKKKPFQRFKAFVKSFGYGKGGSWPLVEVTSITDDGKQAWVSLGSERQKTGSNYGNNPLGLYLHSAENAALVAEIHEHEKAIEALNAKITAAESKLQVWKPSNPAA